MKRAAGLSLLLLSLLTLKVAGQIDGAVITPSAFNVGSVLTAGYTNTPKTNDHVDFEWFYSPSGTSIGTSSTYTVLSSDQGKAIYITATEKKDADNSIVAGPFTSSSTTVNSFPVASYAGISGLPHSGMTLTGTYVYSDADSDPESGTTFQWYRGNSPGGASPVTIGSGLSSYTLTNSDVGHYIGFSVTPSSSSGSVPGNTVTSAVWTGPVLANSAPTVASVNILGSLSVNSTLYGNYVYSDAEGDVEGSSGFQWYRASDASGTGSVTIPGATSLSYKLTNADTLKYIGFSVQPAAITGTSPGTTITTTTYVGPVTNNAPVASSVSISGGLNAGNALTGHYVYSDQEGDIEDGSTYQWYSSGTLNGTYTAISGENGIVHVITLYEHGEYFKFYVTPKAATGRITGTEVQSSGWGPANSKPVASSPSISGTVAIGNTLTAVYTYSDVDGDGEGTTTFRWFRNGTVISGAVSGTYLITSDDEGYKLSFEVTPVSSIGYPDTGDPVVSAETIAVPSSGSLPVASQVCVEGTNATGNSIKGKYLFTYSPSEDHSVYRWMRDNDTISGETSITYTLTSVDAGHDIYFVVIPYSKYPAHKKGIAVKSAPLARITMAADSYSVADSPVTLTANVSGGVFSGTGVSSGIFSPAIAGTAGSPYTIYYNLSIINSSTTCSETASDQISVVPVSSYFSSFRNYYCHDGGTDTIYVENVPGTATSMTFRMTNPSGIVGLLNPKAVIIDPGQMRPGNKVDTLFFTYYDGGSYFPVSRPLVIDSVGTNTALVNLDPAYCEGSGKKYVTIEGTYPGGGSAIWTGTLMTDLTATSAFIDPSLGSAGSTYPITYQYVSPIGCKSNTVSKSVKINSLPNSSFTLDATYNIEGGAKDLTPSVSGGNFVGPGVIGTKFYPSIAGQGTFEIKYYITDINSCSSNTSKTTTVRKAEGTINNLPAIICYRDTTYNISVSSLPSGTTVTDFTNTKNSLIHSAGSLLAQYGVAAAGSGNDTVRFSYKWDGVDYTLSRAVFIDSIGKVVISGLKDNYCDYEGTVSLRVFVENSTGNGNFSFTGPDTSFTNYGNLADFYPSKTPPSALPYYVKYTHVSTVNSSGCRKTVSSPVTVNKSPAVAILTSRVTVNYEESPFVLSGSPSDGLFSGKGIYRQGPDYVFNPLVAGLGNIEITFSYVDSKGCYAAVKDTLIVSNAQGTIQGINSNSQYCYDGPDDTLKYVSVSTWLFGQFIGDGLTNISSGQAVFRPSASGKGDHKIVFRYFDLMGTPFEVPAVLKVDSIGQVSINNLSIGAVFCNNQAAFPLFGSNPDGVFSGPVTGNMLDPSKGSGNTSVGFTYTNAKTGCSSSTNVPIVINSAPLISFVPADVCIESNKDSTRFINNTTPADSISKWSWVFNEAGGSSSSSLKEPEYLYKTGGLHKVSLTATTIKDCSATLENTIDLGVKPIAGFTWQNECYHTGDSLLFKDNTISSSKIISRTWNFFDGDSLHTTNSLKYPQKSVGWLKVRYIVNTNYTGCSDTITQNIYVRPTVALANGDSYYENFENGNGGWVKDYKSVNSWTLGTPDRKAIKKASSGTNAWYTAYDITKRDTALYSVVSPCFDFTVIERPMIRLWTWKRFEQNRNGASLQYKIGDSGSWEYVGTLDDGIHWFNSALIGTSGSYLLGWTTSTPDTAWSESRHKLDWLQGKKDVKFRISYGSDGTSNTD
ncbi:MAG: hypothetical protein ABSA76_07485, partial [Bacteroidales bacterium]